jgi:hypothetical protein
MTTDLRFRSPALVLALLGLITDDDDPVPWNALIEHFSSGSKYTAKTIENTLGDLAKFGAIQRIGQYAPRRGDTRAVRMTPLGLAWLAGELVPVPTITEPDPQ